MTPAEAEAKYRAEWPALNAAKVAATDRGDVKEAKKCRQMLTVLSQTCEARHDLNKPDGCSVRFCPCCGKRVRHDT